MPIAFAAPPTTLLAEVRQEPKAVPKPAGEQSFTEGAVSSDQSIQRLRPRWAPTDGVYGRFDGDLSLSLGLGGHFDLTSQEPRVFLQGSALFLWTVGPYLHYERSTQASPHTEGVFAAGVELRPLFLLRFSEDKQQGPALADLTLDSLGIGLGGFLAQAGEPAADSGAGFEAWLMGGLPILARANGPWLTAQSGTRVGAQKEWFVRFGLSWDTIIWSPILR